MANSEHSKNSAMVDCPICYKKFCLTEVNAHVDICLEKKENNNQTNETDLPEKKLRLTAWGSLNPTSSPKQNVSKKRSTKTINNGIKLKTSPQAAQRPNLCSFDIASNSSEIDGFVPHNQEEFHSIFKIEEPMVVSSRKKIEFIPLAEKMRPQTLAEYFGQEQILSKQSILRTLLETQEIPSLIFWGPPGCGKTSLAHIISNNCKLNNQSNFVKMSATTSGIGDVKEVMKQAKNNQIMLHRKTILFIDEIHRFNKLQQDAFLPYVENGTIVLIGATTENPSFSLNKALLSRCRVIVLEKLSTEDVEKILYSALGKLNINIVEDGEAFPPTKGNSEELPIFIEKSAVSILSNLCDGDARIALNGLEMAIHSEKGKSKNSNKNEVCQHYDSIIINTFHIKEGLQRSHLLYDRKGLADPLALNQAVATYQGCSFIGMPECEVLLAQCTVYLARAPKSIAIYSAYNKAKSCISNHQGPLPGVPLHLRNAPTKLMDNLGYGKGYKYNPSFKGPVEQSYLPEELQHLNFFS